MNDYRVEVERNGYEAFAVGMGMDALRIAIGKRPKRPPEDVMRWLRAMLQNGPDRPPRLTPRTEVS